MPAPQDDVADAITLEAFRLMLRDVRPRLDARPAAETSAVGRSRAYGGTGSEREFDYGIRFGEDDHLTAGVTLSESGAERVEWLRLCRGFGEGARERCRLPVGDPDVAVWRKLLADRWHDERIGALRKNLAVHGIEAAGTTRREILRSAAAGLASLLGTDGRSREQHDVDGITIESAGEDTVLFGLSPVPGRPAGLFLTFERRGPDIFLTDVSLPSGAFLDGGDVRLPAKTRTQMISGLAKENAIRAAAEIRSLGRQPIAGL